VTPDEAATIETRLGRAKQIAKRGEALRNLHNQLCHVEKGIIVTPVGTAQTLSRDTLDDLQAGIDRQIQALEKEYAEL